MALDKVLYTATATATGGRTGTAQSSDGALKLDLSTPRELGGAGGAGQVQGEQAFEDFFIAHVGVIVGPAVSGGHGGV